MVNPLFAVGGKLIRKFQFSAMKVEIILNEELTLNQLKYQIKKFVQHVDNNINLRYCKNNFCYDYTLNKIYWYDCREEDDNLFSQHIHEKHKYNYKVPILLISLLHEIGHKKTDSDLSVSDFFKAQQIDDLYDTEPYKTFVNNNDKKTVYKYYNTKRESLATKWAIKYYKKNKEHIDLLATKINDKYL